MRASIPAQGPANIWNPSGPTGPTGDDPMTSLTRLQEQVKGAFIWLGLLTTAFAGGLFYLISVMNSGFDRIDSRIATLSEQVSDMRVDAGEQRATLKSIDNKLNNRH